MSSQFVDINADGYKDIVTGSFSGTPQIIMGSSEGLEKPKPILNKDGDTVLLSAFWNDKDNKWDETDRSKSEGHCTSAWTIDWDADGDHDLLLSGYYGGELYLCLNEGTATEPVFATTNTAVVAADKPLVISQGISSVCTADWNGDGLFDILCGGSKGGVYFYANQGTAGSPKFGKPEMLFDVLSEIAGAATNRMSLVPTVDGQPAIPGDHFHLEVADYDRDGDLDLLIGSTERWDSGERKVLTDEEQERLAEIEKSIEELQQQTKEASAGKTGEERLELRRSKEYRERHNQCYKLQSELAKLKPNPIKHAGQIWVLKRKGKGVPTRRAATPSTQPNE